MPWRASLPRSDCAAPWFRETTTRWVVAEPRRYAAVVPLTTVPPNMFRNIAPIASDSGSVDQLISFARDPVIRSTASVTLIASRYCSP